jgi:hypothetical protein
MSQILPTLALVVLASLGTLTQSTEDVQIVVTGYKLMANGAEASAEVSRATGPLKIGVPTSALFSVTDCGYFSVQAAPFSVYPGPEPFLEGATFYWRLEVRPTRVVDHVVTFRLRWVRPVDNGAGVGPRSEEIELTLKPGESRPIDSVPVASKGGTVNSRPCNVKSASLRVSAEFPMFDGRLVGAEIWLVEKLPDGKEQSQLQTVRGRPHQEIPFHFDRVSDGKNSFDFSGHITADVETGSIEIDLETIRAVPDAPATRDAYQAARWFRSTVRVTPNETVEVALTEADPSSKRSPAGRIFSLRIRARQLR